MFSLVIIATNINRRANIYNSLAASAMILLLINPNNLFEVGFQLSYAAVFGIVFLQPRFEKLWQAPNKVSRFFWSLFTVSLAAQIATFPLTAFYFNQFPSYFWLSNMIVIPAVTILIPLGILLLLISTVPVLSSVITVAVKFIIDIVYHSMQTIEKLPGSTLGISLNHSELWLLVVSLICAFIFIRNQRIFYLKTALLFLLFMLTSFLYAAYQQNQMNELIVYNNTSNITIQLISGHNNYIISEDTLNQDRFLLQQTQNVTRKLRLNDPLLLQLDQPFSDDYLVLSDQFLYFNGKSLWIDPGIPLSFSPDYAIVNYYLKDAEVLEDSDTNFISTKYLNKGYSHNNFHSLKTDGAFCARW